MSRSIPKEQFLAAGRRSLATIAAWTNLLYDYGAGTRLADIPIPPDGVYAADDPTDYLDVRSAGGRIEDSIVLSNLDRAFDFTHSGHAPQTLNHQQCWPRIEIVLLTPMRSDAWLGTISSVFGANPQRTMARKPVAMQTSSRASPGERTSRRDSRHSASPRRPPTINARHTSRTRIP